MLEMMIVAVLVAAALVVSAVASSYRRFAALRAGLLEHLRTAAPEVSVNGLTDVGFSAQILGSNITVDLATLLRQRPKGLTEREWFDQVVVGMRARVPLPDIAPFALVRDRIVPQLKPASYAHLFQRYPAPQRLVWRPWLPGIAVTYVITGLHQFTAVTQRALEVWATTPDTLHALAVANLRTHTEHLLAELGGPRRRYEHLDGLDATRILVADLILPGDIGDPVVALPEETVLLVAPAAEQAGLAAEAAVRHRATTRPLSPQVFRLGPAGPVPLD
jgi:hypothetical protein